MASIHVSPEYIAIGLGHSIEVVAKKSQERFTYPHVFKQDCNDSEKEIDHALFSPSHQYFAALYSDKVICVWKSGQETGFEKFLEFDVKRRSTSLAFSEDEAVIYVADKSGDLYSCQLEGVPVLKEAQPLLGHISMLLDVAVTKRYVITADRDEKIRISDKEHPYVIHRFCLGHTEFVLRLQILTEDLVMSCSGDATVRVWDVKSGHEVQSLSFAPDGKSGDVSQKTSAWVPSVLAFDSLSRLLAIARFRSRTLHIYRFESGAAKPLRKLYDVSLPTDAKVLDCDFDRSESGNEPVALYVLLLAESKLRIHVLECSYTESTEAADASDRFGSVVEGFSIGNTAAQSFSQLFKSRFSTDKYEKFQKRKLQATRESVQLSPIDSDKKKKVEN